jgi:hypothetical protein
MSDYNSSLPVRTQNNGDVVSRISDGLTTSQLLGVDAAGKITAKIDDAAGNGLTSQANGSQQALDVGIDVGGVQIDPRQIRALTPADIVSVEAASASGLTINGSVSISNFPSSQTVTISGQPIQIEAATAGGLTINGTVTSLQGTSPWVENLSQVGGQAISLGQKTGISSVPVVIASDQSNIPVNLHDGSGNSITSTGGSLNVNVTSSAASNPFVKYNTTASLSPSSTTTHEVAPGSFPFYVSGAWGAASGKIKDEIWVNTAGLTMATSVRSGGTQYLVGFNSTATPNVDKTFQDEIVVTTGNSVYSLITNDDLQAMDVYSTINGHS